MEINYEITPDNKTVGKGITALGTLYRATASCSKNDTFEEQKGKKIVDLKIHLKQSKLTYRSHVKKLKKLQEAEDMMLNRIEKAKKDIEFFEDKIYLVSNNLAQVLSDGTIVEIAQEDGGTTVGCCDNTEGLVCC